MTIASKKRWIGVALAVAAMSAPAGHAYPLGEGGSKSTAGVEPAVATAQESQSGHPIAGIARGALERAAEQSWTGTPAVPSARESQSGHPITGIARGALERAAEQSWTDVRPWSGEAARVDGFDLGDAGIGAAAAAGALSLAGALTLVVRTRRRAARA